MNVTIVADVLEINVVSKLDFFFSEVLNHEYKFKYNPKIPPIDLELGDEPLNPKIQDQTPRVGNPDYNPDDTEIRTRISEKTDEQPNRSYAGTTYKSLIALFNYFTYNI